MQLSPIGERIVIHKLEKEETTASGIVLPSSAQEQPQYAEVVAISDKISNQEDYKDAVKIGDHHITAVFLCRSDHKLCRIRRQPVITVHKLEICSLCPFNSLISRIRNPGIFFVDHHHTLIRLRIRITDLA